MNVEDVFIKLLEEIDREKPGDRSPVDRSYAVTRTMVEQAFAYFVTFANPFPGRELAGHPKDPFPEFSEVSLRSAGAVR